MRQAELDGPADDGERVDEAVCLGDETAIDASGGCFCGGAVVFRRLGGDFDLLLREPVAEPGVGPDDLPGFQMVGGAVHGEAGVVIRCRRVYQVGVHVIETRQVQRLGDDAPRVVLLVGFVKMPVAGDDFRFDVCLQSVSHRW